MLPRDGSSREGQQKEIYICFEEHGEGKNIKPAGLIMWSALGICIVVSSFFYLYLVTWKAIRQNCHTITKVRDSNCLIISCLSISMASQ